MIHDLAVVGQPPEHRDHRDDLGIPPVIHPTARVEALCTVDAGIENATRIGHNTWLMKCCHVGHDAFIGDHCELAPGCIVGGHVRIGNHVRVGMGAIFKPFVQVGDGARIGAGAVVIRDVPAGETWVGNPARCIYTPEMEMTPSEAAGWDALIRSPEVQEALAKSLSGNV